MLTYEKAKKSILCCESCFEKICTSDDIDISGIKLPDKVKVIDSQYIDWLYYDGKCPHCGDVENPMLLCIDEQMYPLIYKLNKNGYPTVYCCEGHFDLRGFGGYQQTDPDDYLHSLKTEVTSIITSYPYIVFEANWSDDVYTDILKHLPQELHMRRYFQNRGLDVLDPWYRVHIEVNKDCLFDVEFEIEGSEKEIFDYYGAFKEGNYVLEKVDTIKVMEQLVDYICDEI